MTKEEYIEKRDALKAKYDKDWSDLAREYAVSNRVADIGDIVEDRSVRVLVQELRFHRGWGNSELPECVYFGIEVRKADNLPKKNGAKGAVYQKSIVRVIKKTEE